MATTLYLTNGVANAIGTFFDVSTAAGGGVQTAVVNTVAGATNIQWTRTGGGVVLEWISGRSPSGGWTLSGLVTVRVWALESGTSANAGARIRLYKRDAAGIETELTGSPWDQGTEFGLTGALRTWSFTPTAMAFAEDDRLVIRLFMTNAGGTMTNSRSSTLAYNDTSGNSADSSVALTETVSFKVEDIHGAATIASDGDTAAAAGVAAIAGAAAVTAGEDALSAAGVIVLAATAAIAAADDVAAAAGTLTLTAAAAVDEAGDTISDSAGDTIVGSLALTEAADVMAAAGVLSIPMFDDTVTEALAEAYAIAPADEVILHTIELRHPIFVDDDGNPDSIWAVRNDEAFTAKLEADAPIKGGQTVTFKAIWFEFTPPSVEASSSPQIDVSIDVVNRDIIENLDRAVAEPTKIIMVYRPYLASDLTGPQMRPPPSFVLSTVKVGALTVTAQARVDLNLDGSFPRRVYRASEFPGLIGQ